MVDIDKSLKYPSGDNTICRLDDINAFVAEEFEKITTNDPLGHAIANPEERVKETDLENVTEQLFTLELSEISSNDQFCRSQGPFYGSKIVNFELNNSLNPFFGSQKEVCGSQKDHQGSKKENSGSQYLLCRSQMARQELKSGNNKNHTLYKSQEGLKLQGSF